MSSNTVSLPEATSAENLAALAEVSHFGTTDMGHTGQGPWTYRILQEPMLTTELIRLARANSQGFVDLVSFQPCPPHVSQSQDRYVVEEWDLPGGLWQFNGIFDGHLNNHTVDYVVQTLPFNIRRSLHSALTANVPMNSADVSDLLRSSVLQLDNSITSRFLKLFPQDPKALSRLTDRDIQHTFHNEEKGAYNYMTAMRCLGGTTLLLTLTDPRKQNLWVTNLGVLGHQIRGCWYGVQINAVHNANNINEVQRIRNEHPNEVASIRDDRVVGFLEPTRAIGDTWLKIPGIYSSLIFSKLEQPWISPDIFEKYAQRLLTPPYISTIPDVYHHVLPDAPYFVIMCSDGLPSMDRYHGMEQDEMIKHWTEITVKSLNSYPASNAALRLLRDAIGGDNTHQVSCNLTVEMDEPWVDDTTILIQRGL